MPDPNKDLIQATKALTNTIERLRKVMLELSATMYRQNVIMTTFVKQYAEPLSDDQTTETTKKDSE